MDFSILKQYDEPLEIYDSLYPVNDEFTFKFRKEKILLTVKTLIPHAKRGLCPLSNVLLQKLKITKSIDSWLTFDNGLSAYFFEKKIENTNYIFFISFEETQPMRYQSFLYYVLINT